MKKFKIVIGIGIFIILIVGIVILFSNVEKLMPDYEGKVMQHSNKYFNNNEEINPMEYIEKATILRTLTQEELELFQTNSIKKILKKNEEEEDSGEAEKETASASVAYDDHYKEHIEQYVVPETKYGDIICKIKEVNTIYYCKEVILFTKDLKNIYYFQDRYPKTGQVSDEKQEIDKEKTISQLQKFIEELNIPVKTFEPTIIKKDNQEYSLKDEYQNLEILYNAENSQIIEFKLNFK